MEFSDAYTMAMDMYGYSSVYIYKSDDKCKSLCIEVTHIVHVYLCASTYTNSKVLMQTVNKCTPYLQVLCDKC